MSVNILFGNTINRQPLRLKKGDTPDYGDRCCNSVPQHRATVPLISRIRKSIFVSDQKLRLILVATGTV